MRNTSSKGPFSIAMSDYQRVRCFFFLTEKPQVCGLWNPPKLLKKDAAVLSKELQSRAGLSWRHPFHVSSGQNHGWLFDIGDYTTQYLCGDYNKPI